MPVRQNGGKPAQVKNNAVTNEWDVFEWYENEVEEGLQILYRRDRAERQKIAEVICEMGDSNMFWKLMAHYTDASESAYSGGPEAALRALLARVYIAGSLRKAPLIQL